MTPWRRGAATLRLFFKQQLALAIPEPRKHEVKHPGERGGKGYFNRWGRWQYGTKPTEFQEKYPEPAVPPPEPVAPIAAGTVTPVPPYTYAEQPDLKSYDVILVNSSGGKDSAAMLDEVVRRAREAGVEDRVEVVHCDVSSKEKRVEWKGARELAERQAVAHGKKFQVVHRELGGLIEQIEKRGKFPGMARNQRFCTADQKTHQVEKLLTAIGDDLRPAIKRRFPGRVPRILNCIGLRGAENPARGWPNRQPFEVERSNRNVHVDRWLPIQHWSHAQVWKRIEEAGIEMPPTYKQGVQRYSCVLCIFLNRTQATLAGLLDPEVLKTYAETEAKIGFKFRQDYSIADVAGDIDKLIAEYGSREAAIAHVQKDPRLGEAMLDSRVHMLLFLRAKRTAENPAQLGLFADKPVQHPGSRGGHGYYDAKGQWVYGDPPKPSTVRRCTICGNAIAYSSDATAHATCVKRQAAAAPPAPTYQEAGTKAPAFKSWFGDWENDPASASKVVDAEGEPEKEYEAKNPHHKPVVMYHGSQAQFREFDPGHIGKWNLYGPGFYFTNDREVVEGKYDEGTKHLYFDTREEAEAVPNRQGFVWKNDPGEYEGAGKWVAVVKDRKLLVPGYQHKGEIKLTDEERHAIAENITTELVKRGRGYLSQTEEGSVLRSLTEFQMSPEALAARHARQKLPGTPPAQMSLADLFGLIGGQPYNLNVYDIAERSGTNIAGRIYPCYLNIRDPVDIEARDPAPYVDRIWTALHQPGSNLHPLLDRAAFDKLAHPPDDPAWGDIGVNLETFLESLNQWVEVQSRLTDYDRRIAEGVHPLGTNLAPMTKQDWPALFKAAGYDGITHTGGIRVGDHKHRVWIAFDPHQIKAVENEGAFDPTTADIFKANVQRPGSRGGHWYIGPGGDVRYGTPPVGHVQMPPLAPDSQLAQALARGVYTVRLLGTKPSYYWKNEKPEYKIALDAATPDSWVTAPPRPYPFDRPERIRRYDPKLAFVDDSDPDVKGILRMRPDAGLLDGLGSVPSQPGVLWRGMSAEEYAHIEATGMVQSLGDYNFVSQQQGLTYYSTDPTQAESYAHEFAPWQYAATPLRPAYIIGVRDPGNAVPVSGTAPNERGIPTPIPAADIVAVYQGVPYATESGTAELDPSRVIAQAEYEVHNNQGTRTSVGWRALPGFAKASLRAGAHPGRISGMPLLFLRTTTWRPASPKPQPGMYFFLDRGAV